MEAEMLIVSISTTKAFFRFYADCRSRSFLKGSAIILSGV